MMSDVPVGTSGATKERDTDLTTIYQGGSNFLARMKALSDLRDSQERAFANLRIGTDIKAAGDAAKAAAADAAAKLNEATAVLDKAKKDAAVLVAAAKTEADTARFTAASEAKKTMTAADAVKADADSYAAKTKTVADDNLKKAQAASSAADAARVNAATSFGKHQAAVAEALAEKQRAQDLQGRLTAKLTRLQEVLKELSGA